MLRKSKLMMSFAVSVIVPFILLADFAFAQTRVAIPAATRGELLYTTHCVACHSTEMHWRDKKVALDWASLTAQVARWQEVSGLSWNADDIAEVTRYLNLTLYRYPTPD